MATSAPLSSSLVQRYNALLPPVATGMRPLARLAGALRADQQAGRLERAQAVELLLLSYVGAAESLGRMVRGATGLAPEDAEEVVQIVGVRLGVLFEGWRGEPGSPDSFGAYLHRVMVREAQRLARREQRANTRRDEFTQAREGGDVAGAPEPAIVLHQQALRRYVWYVYGSPDNPDRLSHDKSLVDFLALSTRLQERSYSWLVDDCQPRPGCWGPRSGQDPAHWWRNRAALAYARLVDSLKLPQNLRVYMQICEDLGLTAM